MIDVRQKKAEPILLILIIAGWITVAVCTVFYGKSDAALKKNQKPISSTEINLKEIGIKGSIKVPYGGRIVKRTFCTTIDAGDSFSVHIHKDFLNLNEIKKRAVSKRFNTLKKIILEDKNFIIYKSEIMGFKEFHFAAILNMEGERFIFEDAKGGSYSLEEILIMLDSVNSFKKIRC